MRTSVNHNPSDEADDVYLSLGSNIEDREENLRTSVNELSSIGEIVKVSSIFQTEPWGRRDQNDFLNIACILKCGFAPLDLLEAILEIERRMGRMRGAEWSPRTIDIDIVFIGDSLIDEPGLTVPHPHFHQRRFVLEPLMEIAPEFQHPKFGKTISQLHKSCSDPCEVNLIKRWN
ncbi:MAG: 2-amino-4-hydroxy-6-hydroxymethyldihydropteridine diphosphokinase [candidate division Zixibacteria bacterium]|nr:2-amino-4-hydroxy-6-hydroxymethyldihydropteridine diphosphokinase [Candidatus Tariuqbacter arcticus]